MPTPIEMYFPDSLLEVQKRAFERYQKSLHKEIRDPVQIIRKCISPLFKQYSYGFLDSLIRDFYSPTQEERQDLQIYHHNCTMIIVPFYLMLQAAGIEPEIVQFHGFRNIKDKKDHTKQREQDHFSLVAKIEQDGTRREYLIDPFHEICAEISKKEQGCWKLKGYSANNVKARVFEKVVAYTKEEFAQMLYDLRSDATSLDLLVAGQKVRELPLAKTNCIQMLYYADDPAALTTRIYIPQWGISDKALTFVHHFDTEGNLKSPELLFSFAQETTWHKLVGEKRVAVTTYSTITRLARLFGAKKIFNKQPSIEDLLDAPAMLGRKEAALDIAQAMYQQLSADEQANLWPLVLARTIYEAEAKKTGYVFDAEIRDQRIKTLLSKINEYNTQIQQLDDLLWKTHWNYSSTNRNDIRKAKRNRKVLEQKKEDLNFGYINVMRKYNKLVYHRTMDKLLFGQHYEQTSSDAMQNIVNTRALDWRVGYLAIVTDFFPYAFEARKDLEVEQFMPSLYRRVKARITQNPIH